MKNNLDERQELKLLKIEHNGCWFAFWGLVVVILAQCVFENLEVKNIIGEVVILMSLSVYIVVSCLKEGIWDRKLKPDLKTNFFISTIASFVAGIIWFIITYRDYHSLKGSVGVFIITFIMTNAVCILLLIGASKIYKKRVHDLED